MCYLLRPVLLFLLQGRLQSHLLYLLATLLLLLRERLLRSFTVRRATPLFVLDTNLRVPKPVLIFD